MAVKKTTKKAEAAAVQKYVKAKGYRLPHGYEVVVRKTAAKPAKKKK